MELLEIMQNRHSVRNYTDEDISEDKIEKILQAGSLSPSGRGLRPWEIILIKNKDTLLKLSECRDGSAQMLKQANAAVVVIANGDLTDVWIEDCSIVMSNMHLMADSLGVGSCWIQGRQRKTADGKYTDDYIREILGYPSNYKLEAILSLGMPASHKPKTQLSEIHTEKIHYEKF